MNQNDAHSRQVNTKPVLLQRRGVHPTTGGVWGWGLAAVGTVAAGNVVRPKAQLFSRTNIVDWRAFAAHPSCGRLKCTLQQNVAYPEILECVALPGRGCEDSAGTTE